MRLVIPIEGENRQVVITDSQSSFMPGFEVRVQRRKWWGWCTEYNGYIEFDNGEVGLESRVEEIACECMHEADDRRHRKEARHAAIRRMTKKYDGKTYKLVCTCEDGDAA